MSQQIASTILSQIKAGRDGSGLNSGVTCMMCWGFHDPYIFPANESESEPHDGGLLFSVQGQFHKGTVVVLLNLNDTYTILFRNQDLTVRHEMSGIYCDQLTELVDSYVETNYNKNH